MSDVLIVGAGMAGLMAAHRLTDVGLTVTLVDKGRYPGGRMASRRFGPALVDHGAQFFTVRDAAFAAWVARWQADDVVYEWSRGWSDSSLGLAPPDGHPRYAVRGGMRQLGLRLAGGLDIRQGARITRAEPLEQGWQAQDNKGGSYTARALLLTPPVPQSLDILAAGEVPLAEQDRAALQHIAYAPCLAGLFWLDRATTLPPPGGLQRPQASISWIADNWHKGLVPEPTVVTVHAGPHYSRLLWNAPDWEALLALEAGLRLHQQPDTTIHDRHLHRWRYARPVATHAARCLVAEGVAPLAFAGDAFDGPRVEGAALSGLAAAEALRARLE
jgi:renalase